MNSLLNDDLFNENLALEPNRKGFGEGLLEAGNLDDSIVAISADLIESTQVEPFAKAHPDRFVELGVAEQNMVTVASGLAAVGKKPFTTSYASFSPGRNWEQIRTTICLNDRNVKIVGEEVAFLRTLPHMTLIVPCDYEEAKKATIAIGEMNGPAYIRFGRSPVPLFTTPEHQFEIGKAQVLTQGNHVALIACGSMVWEAMLAAEKLAEKGIHARVINCPSIKPFDFETITAAARECGAIVTAEEHQVHAGLGGAVAEAVVKNHPVPMEFVGVKDSFGGSGEPEELMKKFGLTWKEIYASALIAMHRRDNGSLPNVRKIKEVAEYAG